MAGTSEEQLGYERLGAKRLRLVDCISQSVGFMGPVFSAAFLIPPVALLLGVLIRHEHVALLSVLGSAVCVTGAWLIRPKQQVSPAPRKPEITYERALPARS